jgi:tRNA pseudouridine38-40 synthase
MTTYRLTLEYDGTNYSGWQLQAGQDSIQGRVEAALERLFKTQVRIHGAGRTDAGVHALGQVAAFRTVRPFGDDLRRALNALLPPDIAIQRAEVVHDDFDPRRDARSRIYEYCILNRTVRSALKYRFAWLVREPLDFAAMNLAAAQFLCEHDFAAFRRLGSAEKTTVRRVLNSEWLRRDGDWLIYRVEATAFLRHMVRAMVALMVTIGRGILPPDSAGEILRSRDRGRIAGAAPPCGLYLVEVRY